MLCSIQDGTCGYDFVVLHFVFNRFLMLITVFCMVLSELIRGLGLFLSTAINCFTLLMIGLFCDYSQLWSQMSFSACVFLFSCETDEIFYYSGDIYVVFLKKTVHLNITHKDHVFKVGSTVSLSNRNAFKPVSDTYTINSRRSAIHGESYLLSFPFISMPLHFTLLKLQKVLVKHINKYCVDRLQTKQNIYSQNA